MHNHDEEWIEEINTYAQCDIPKYKIRFYGVCGWMRIESFKISITKWGKMSGIRIEHADAITDLNWQK